MKGSRVREAQKQQEGIKKRERGGKDRKVWCEIGIWEWQGGWLLEFIIALHSLPKCVCSWSRTSYMIFILFFLTHNQHSLTDY